MYGNHTAARRRKRMNEKVRICLEYDTVNPKSSYRIQFMVTTVELIILEDIKVNRRPRIFSVQRAFPRFQILKKPVIFGYVYGLNRW